VLVLVIDTSSAATTVALATVDPAGESIKATHTNVDARGHVEVLAPTVARCLDDAGAKPDELAAIVAGLGPGPYTGLRVGLVTAAALGDALRIPTYGVCSLDGIGFAASTASTALRAPLLVAADARRREVYWAAYRDGVRTHGPHVAKPGTVDLAQFSAVAGAGARLYADVLDLPLLDQDYPDPLALLRVAGDRIRAHRPSELLQPLYLRRPDAVEPVPRKVVT
jgi:tRNA threonylcarbamoyl adenosine modification protein YeaZ